MVKSQEESSQGPKDKHSDNTKSQSELNRDFIDQEREVKKFLKEKDIHIVIKGKKVRKDKFYKFKVMGYMGQRSHYQP